MLTKYLKFKKKNEINSLNSCNHQRAWIVETQASTTRQVVTQLLALVWTLTKSRQIPLRLMGKLWLDLIWGGLTNRIRCIMLKKKKMRTHMTLICRLMTYNSHKMTLKIASTTLNSLKNHRIKTLRNSQGP